MQNYHNLHGVQWGTVIHEIGHALGLYHEQSRSDRDNYVTVLWNNMDLSYWPQFDEVNVTSEQTYGIPYDYGSIMHYASTVIYFSFKILQLSKLEKFVIMILLILCL